MFIDRIATDRLELRDWTPALRHPAARRSLEAALPDVLTPRVLARLPEPLQPRGDMAAWVAARAEESEVCLATERASGALVGMLMLAEDRDPQGGRILRIGYFLAERAWGKGYATEIVRGVAAALRGHGPLSLIGGVGKDNPASRRVLEKAGFRIDPALSSRQTDMLVLPVA